MIPMKRIIWGAIVVILTIVVFVVVVHVNNFNKNLERMENIAQRTANMLRSTYVGAYGGDPWTMEHWMAVQAGSKDEDIDWTIVYDDYDRDMTIVKYTVSDSDKDYYMVWY